MTSGAKKAMVALGASAAVAATGGLAFVLVKRTPHRQAFREATQWQSANAHYAQSRATRRPPDPSPPKSVDTSKSRSAPMKSADPKPTPGLFGAVKEVVYEFLNDDVMTQAAALAFYAGLAFAPLLTVTVWVMRVFYSDEAKDKLGNVLGQVLGSAAAGPLKDLLKNTSDKANSGMTIAGLVSIALVAFSASGVFGQVQAALNTIWHVQAKPTNGVVGFLRKRVLSLGMLASILFLLMTSLIVSVVLQGLLSVTSGTVGAVLGVIVNNAVSVGLFTVLFAALFRFVPDAKIGWRPVWIGGLLSAILFTAGKFGLAFYLGHTDYSSSYGAAAGSFVALLVWVYYSSVILLVGAEATEVTARRMGQALEPDEHAVRVVQTTEPA